MSTMQRMLPASTKSDGIAYEIFKSLGFEVEIIPPSDHQGKKEADFLVSYHDQTAIVECKLKEDDPQVAKEKENKLANGKISIIDGSHGRNETHSGIIRHAEKQLKSSADKPHDFKIISFICTGSNVKTKQQQFIDTIYGSTTITDGRTAKTCYFYRHSDFMRRNSIDGAVAGYILVESRELINTLVEQIRLFGLPQLESLDG